MEWGVGNKQACSQVYTDYEIKAAFVFNFGKFTTWPYDIANTYTVWIYQSEIGTPESPFKSIMEQMAKDQMEMSENETWKVLIYQGNMDEFDNAIGAKILFIPQIEQSQLREILLELRNRPVLTIGNTIPNFCEWGGMINLTAKGAPKQFQINETVESSTKVVTSPKLKALATIVNTTSE